MSTIGGQQVIASTGNGSGTLYVAAMGEHFVVRIQATKGGSKGMVTFSHYDRPVRPAKPGGRHKSAAAGE